jgi:hypothetical protein
VGEGVAGCASPPEQAAVSKPSAMTSAARPRRVAHMASFSQPGAFRAVTTLAGARNTERLSVLVCLQALVHEPNGDGGFTYC